MGEWDWLAASGGDVLDGLLERHPLIHSLVLRAEAREQERKAKLEELSSLLEAMGVDLWQVTRQVKPVQQPQQQPKAAPKLGGVEL